ncbi:MAG: amidohydrolase, partial [Candidatus Limnocylindria bacterium]
VSAVQADLVVAGRVVLAALPGRLETAEAIGIAAGRVVSAGTRREIVEAAAPRARMVDAGGAAVVPGLHDFHLHLVGMARARRELRLDEIHDPELLLSAFADAAALLRQAGWLRGRGWHDVSLAGVPAHALAAAARGRPVLVYSHDGHSAWASPEALRLAGIGAATADPPGGRVERDGSGAPSGVLRERATDLVEAVAGRLGGPDLDEALDETVTELLALGITAATDAGDSGAANGDGAYADLGDRASRLLAAANRLDGRLRLTVNLPAEAVGAAAAHGLRTGSAIPGTATLRAGWVKAFVDGALGSRTAALFAPYSCGDAAAAGLARMTVTQLDELLAEAARHGLSVAVHAIGDRGAALVLDALERTATRAAETGAGTIPHRIEHLQLLRPADRRRLARLGVTASVQPVHCASDRGLVEGCWAGRAGLAYPWRSLARAGVRLAFGSDAPIESPNPWLGIFAAVHRRFPGDGTEDWHPEQALEPVAALAAYTSGPAAAAVLPDHGHLRPGATADLAVLNVGLETLLQADEALAGVRSDLTMVAGREVHRT